ncbi:amino acid adenylation domain-containing protein [Methylomonas sp. MO1]|uniref:non-ribosomal peptide synthetase n=1 Tax=Methylomonas sp. MO1 TaxID=3073619 RepID=UPI0028A55134|nr:amino acid adenylation domain-containing protein [Methylomonas sp. MO1]MDT4291636.1 amino acid adenylation domain-containing protein [Methylomonas sp. MO1]
MSVSTKKVIELSKEKQALLLKRLSDKSAAVHRGIGKRKQISPCPLSFSQERLWFLTRLEPDDPFYNMAGVVRVQGPLDVAILEQALNEIVRHHEILRTSFTSLDGHPRQVIHACGDIDLKQIDLSDLPFEHSQQTAETLQKVEARQAFDLEQLPLMRVLLIKLADENHRLSITLHHIVADEWSLRLLIKEVGQFYRQLQLGQSLFDSGPAIQYADFAEWQRQYLQGGSYAQQLGYWQNQLAAAPSSLDLPTDYPRPHQMSHRGGDFRFLLPGELGQELITLSRQADTTLFAVMMAAFNVLLWRYSGQTDICIGFPIANRNRREIEELIGFFVNLQVLRSDLSGNPSFLTLLQKIKQRLLEAQNHQDLPFERLVEALRPQRELSRSPLFQVMLVYQHTAFEDLNIPGLQFELVEAELQSAKYDLTLNLLRRGDSIDCNINYSSDLFVETTIERMAEHWQLLLESIVDRPDMPISELTIMSQPERQHLLENWNATEVDYPQDRCIHQLFEAQVEKTPYAMALTFEGKSLSYAELNAKANQLAHYLIERGVGPDVLVGICLERSLEMVIGLLGILKAGGAYVPLDPHYPAERLAFMLADIAPSVILTQERFAELDFGGTPMLSLDSDWTRVAVYPADNPRPDLHPSNLAYCIYTSGSTGRPKGVMMHHEALVNHTLWMQQEFSFTNSDFILQKTSFSFDASVWELFTPLSFGARLVLAPIGWERDVSSLFSVVADYEITTLQMVPSLLGALINEDSELPSLPSLKRVFCGGEALPVPLGEKCRQRLEVNVINLYGPTEACIDSSSWSFKATCDGLTAPIGKPIANLRMHILDHSLNPVPIGTHGELHIGGIGLGRGYLNRPDMTAEKFIPDPFGATGGRLYKTGDLVRYRPDGNIDYLGRIDHQVKIRGFRIELGEIEAQLLKQAEIKDAVVIAREDHPGDKRLVAYVVPQAVANNESEQVMVDHLKAQLKHHLPDYMVPGAFVVLDAMPLSTNGKLDRKRLPAPDLNGAGNREYVAPTSEVEERLAEVWQQLLGVKRIGRNDHFFELGGHSLLIIQLIQRLSEHDMAIDARTVFVMPILANMASAITVRRHQNNFEIPPNLLDQAELEPEDEALEEFRL